MRALFTDNFQPESSIRQGTDTDAQEGETCERYSNNVVIIQRGYTSMKTSCCNWILIYSGLWTFTKMLVPFCDIPAQFLTPLNVETKVHYSLDMKKFPGLSSGAPPALMIAPSNVKSDLVECGRECCSSFASLPTNQPQCDYAATAPDLPPVVSLIDAQRELFHLLDSYQLDDSVADGHRGNLTESTYSPAGCTSKPDLCRTAACTRGINALTPSGYCGTRRGSWSRQAEDRTARKYSPYQVGKYRNTVQCAPLGCGRNIGNTLRSNENLSSSSCLLTAVHHNDVHYGGLYGPKSQKSCSVGRQELKELPYSCNYSYSQKALTQCSLDSIGCNISKLPYCNALYQYDYPAITGYTGHNSGYHAQNNGYQLHKENLLPIPTLMV